MINIKNRYTGKVILKVESLYRSDLSNSDLQGSDLRGLNLSSSNLSNSNLSESDLRGSNLRGSDLSNSNLSNSTLYDSDLRGSNLRGSDLRGSDLRYSIGNGREVVTIQDKYKIVIYKDILCVGCQQHEINEFMKFSDGKIKSFAGEDGLIWWKLWKPIIKDIYNSYEFKLVLGG